MGQVATNRKKVETQAPGSASMRSQAVSMSHTRRWPVFDLRQIHHAMASPCSRRGGASREDKSEPKVEKNAHDPSVKHSSLRPSIAVTGQTLITYGDVVQGAFPVERGLIISS